MNDFVAKPVHPQLLYATLLRWLKVRARQRQGVSRDEAIDIGAATVVLEPGRTMALLGGSKDAYARLLAIEHGEDPEHLRDALSRGALDELMQSVHQLKSAAGLLDATAVTSAIERLEQAARKPDASQDSLAPHLEVLATRLTALLASIRQAGRSRSD